MPHLQEGRQDVSAQQRVKTRDDDEWLVGIVRLRCNHSSGQIGRYLGMTSARIRTLCNRVLTDDLKYSGESEDVVRSAYWRD